MKKGPDRLIQPPILILHRSLLTGRLQGRYFVIGGREA